MMTLVDITVWTGKTLQDIILNKLNKQLQAINMCWESEKSDFSSLGLRLFCYQTPRISQKHIDIIATLNVVNMLDFYIYICCINVCQYLKKKWQFWEETREA